jgi:hypothetical protein
MQVRYENAPSTNIGNSVEFVFIGKWFLGRLIKTPAYFQFDGYQQFGELRVQNVSEHFETKEEFEATLEELNG